MEGFSFIFLIIAISWLACVEKGDSLLVFYCVVVSQHAYWFYILIV